MVVADEEEGGVEVVGHVADDVAELVGDVDAAVGHEVVDVVDDDEAGLELLDEGLDVACEPVNIAALVAEDVEAEEMELVLVADVGREFAVDGSADVGAVEGVDLGPCRRRWTGWRGPGWRGAWRSGGHDRFPCR